MGKWSFREHIWSGICTVLFFAGLLAGVIWVQTSRASFEGIFGAYFLNQYAVLQIDRRKLLRYVGRYRLGQYLFLVCCGGLAFAPAVSYFLLFLLGFVCGSVLGISTVQLGFRGILICIAGVIPQIFFYFISYGWIFLWVMKRGRSKRRYLFLAAVGLGILCFGIWTESFLNPLILQQILRKIS